MTQIDADRESVRELLKKPAARVAEVQEALDALPTELDGGLASSSIAFIVQSAAEMAQLSADAAARIDVFAREALNDLISTEEAIMDQLDAFTAEELG